jgi:hypothetical protein
VKTAEQYRAQVKGIELTVSEAIKGYDNEKPLPFVTLKNHCDYPMRYGMLEAIMDDVLLDLEYLEAEVARLKAKVEVEA